MKRSILLVVGVVLASLINVTAFAACPSADLTADCKVGLEDLLLLSSQWPDVYDFNDFAVMASQWLTEGVPNDPCNLVWVYIDDDGAGMKDDTGKPISQGGFTGEMSKYKTTNAQYCQFLNAAEASGDITIDATIVYGANGSNSGSDFVGEVYYDLAGPGYTYNNATNGGAARINWTGSSFTVDSGFDNHPVSYVSWYGSTAFCNYYGYRLPTEWEWQAVADYDGSYIYGCGPSINNNIANCYNSTHPYGTTIVGSFGTYGYGMCDIAGNLWEWTSSLWHPVYSYRVFRGGSWSGRDYRCAVSLQRWYYPYGAGWDVGFRVCR
jgi:hypothetical protein